MSFCNLCKATNLISLLDFGKHPIAHSFLTDPNQDEYLHSVTVCYCERCGLIQLTDPIPPKLLYTNYVCLSSWKSQPHIPRLVDLIEQLTNLDKDAKIIEVGSNDGIFLEALQQRGYRNLLGVEPSEDTRANAREKGIETIGAYFNPASAEDLVAKYGQFDLFISRQVLEHITELESFGASMRRVLKPGAFVLTEVPNFAFSLGATDYSAIWEEHVNYFTPETIGSLLAKIGIRVIHSETVNFSGEALIVFGQYEGNPSSTVSNGYLVQARADALNYQSNWPLWRDALRQYLHEQKNAGRRVAAYGGGCRACSIINFAELKDYIDSVVDDQPEKQGRYMPGSRLPILSSEALQTREIDVCLLMVNAENEEKVIAKHQAYREKGGVFASLHPPSKLLPPFWEPFSALQLS